MNKVVKLVLLGGEAAAKSLVPGFAAADEGVRAVVKRDPDAVTKLIDGIEGGIKAAEFVHGDDIANEALFKAGAALVVQGQKMLRDSLKKQAA